VNKHENYREYDVALVEEDPETGEHVLSFSADLIQKLGWVEGDTLIWSDNGDKTWTLSKKE
jgi:hypothetical protein